MINYFVETPLSMKDVTPENYVSNTVSFLIEGTAIECHNTLRMPDGK
jgi:hypothetical protein